MHTMTAKRPAVMTSFVNDNVYTKSFTPREYQVELLDLARERDMIVCLASRVAQNFLCLQLVHSFACHCDKPGICVCLMEDEQCAIQFVQDVSDFTALSIQHATGSAPLLSNMQVVVTNASVFLGWLKQGSVDVCSLKLLITDQCHLAMRPGSDMAQVMKQVRSLPGGPRVLGLTSSLLEGEGGVSAAAHLEAQLCRLEQSMACRAETASDVLSVLRFYPRPHEALVEAKTPKLSCPLAVEILTQINQAQDFLNDHQFDLSEVYSDFIEELEEITDPRALPLAVLADLQSVLTSMGAWCADRAALVLLLRVEQLKVKTKYERHYLLLCMIASLLIKIRAICDHEFQQHEEHKRIYHFSSHKVLRLLEVLAQFRDRSVVLTPNPESTTSVVTMNEEGRCQPSPPSAIQVTEVPSEEDPLPEAGTQGTPEDNVLDTKLKSTHKCSAKIDNKTRSLANEDCSALELSVISKDTCSSSVLTDNHEAQVVPNGLSERSDDNILEVATEDLSLDSESVADKTKVLNGANVPLPQTSHINLNSSIPVLDDQCELNPSVEINNSEKETVNRNIKKDCVIKSEKQDPTLDQYSCEEVIQQNSSSHIKSNHIPTSELDGSTEKQQKKSKKRKKSTHSGCDITNNVVEENLVNTNDSIKTENVVGTCDSTLEPVACMDEPEDEPLTEITKMKSNSIDANFVEAYLCKNERVQESSKSAIDKSTVDSKGSEQKPQTRTERRFHHQRSPRKFRRPPPQPQPLPGEAEPLCGMVFVARRFTAQVLYHLLNAVRHVVPELASVTPQYTASLGEDGEVRDLEKEHRKQEEVLKRFRLRECNLLVCTPMLEEGVELPRCNLVVRFDPPSSFRAMVQSRGRARVNNAHYITLVEEKDTESYVIKWAQSLSVEKLLLSRCHNCEPPEEEEHQADILCHQVAPYCPSGDSAGASVALCGAMALVNRYCAKLPSDTFTRLTPLWRYEEENGLVRCCVRLPINSPLKREIIGPLTSLQAVARRLAALEMCRALFEVRELDSELQPVGKESFLAQEHANLGLQEEDEAIEEDEDQAESTLEHRPGTTKRRQYYYKKVADSLMECRPEPGQEAYLYHINLRLSCPLPEEQNTRGRKIYPPEESPRGFGILTLKPIPQICPFPIFTRSGEVRVSLELSPSKVVLSSAQSEKVVAFLNYTFSSVLRLQKHLMIFGPESAENSYYIVPVTSKPEVAVDWNFVDMIWEQKESVPSPVPEEERRNFTFDCAKYQDAVVMPWYRNQDQPQYFYVAEICTQLSPKSQFPGGEYHTFEEYYHAKYGLKVQCLTQPLLDVDHTSARLNFLTPRYVNRKGVALPVSSEHTKRNKRENLEQKQILVAELCALHPFPASLWRQAVSLPCILYRINGLLLADELRRKVACDIGLGKEILPSEFRWPPLDFGWSLAEVLQRSREAVSAVQLAITDGSETVENKKKSKGAGKGVILEEDEEEEEGEEHKDEEDGKSWLEIGTWSNDMASQGDDCDSLTDEMPEDLPCNVTLLTGNTLVDGPSGSDWGTGIQSHTRVRYNSPTFNPQRKQGSMMDGGNSDTYSSFSDDDDDDMSSVLTDEPEFTAEISSQPVHPDGLRIEFKGDHVAEAFDDQPAFVLPDDLVAEPEEKFAWDWDDLGPDWQSVKENYEKQVANHQKRIENDGWLLRHTQDFLTDRLNFDSNTESSIHRHPLKCKEISLKGDKELCHKGVYIENSCIRTTTANVSTPDAQIKNAIEKISSSKPEHSPVSEINTEAVAVIDIISVEESWQNPDNTERKSLGLYSTSLPNGEIASSINKTVTEDVSTVPKPCSDTQHKATGDKVIEISPDALPNISSNKLENNTAHIDEPGTSESTVGVIDPSTQVQADESNASEFSTEIEQEVVKTIVESPSSLDYEPTDVKNTEENSNNDASVTRLGNSFSFDVQPELESHPGPSPSIILQALTMSNANDGINLERLETIGDSFLKYAITTYLYCSHENIHEGKLSHLRSKQVSNLQLYRLGRDKQLGRFMIATKFEPHDNWLPPCYFVPWKLEKALIKAGVPPGLWNRQELASLRLMDNETIDKLVWERRNELLSAPAEAQENSEHLLPFVPYNLLTQHSIPDKSLADCVEALIGAYLIACGPRGALLFMSWLGIRVLPRADIANPKAKRYGWLAPPPSPLLRHVPEPEGELARMLRGFDQFEERLKYSFRDRAYLLQAMSHASYSPNRLTDCYQRLEFLGDAVLDYLITRYLYEDDRQHSPGALTDLRSALVNNAIFAVLAVRHGFHQFFLHLSPGLAQVIQRFVRLQQANNHCLSPQYYVLGDGDVSEAEDIEVPKALGDVFESVAGAIFLDSGMSLDAVWRTYHAMMAPELELFSAHVPKSPIRELLEREPETAKFGKPEKLADGRRVRVSVEVFGQGVFRGIGRNYRIAKSTAAKCALRHLSIRRSTIPDIHRFY